MGDLVPQPGIDPGSLHWEDVVVSHWTAREGFNLRVILQVYMKLPDGRRSFEQLP